MAIERSHLRRHMHNERLNISNVIFIFDSSVVINLIKINLLNKLSRLNRVYMLIPEAVAAELGEGNNDIPPFFVIVKETDYKDYIQVKPGLGQGEKGVIALARCLLERGEQCVDIGPLEQATRVVALLDDMDARKSCEKLARHHEQLGCHGTLWLIMYMVKRGVITCRQGINAVDDLARTGAWITQELLEKAIKMISELCVERSSKPPNRIF